MTDKRIVLVTGASKGIGRAAALEVARRGAHVVAVARSEDALIALDDEALKETGEAMTLVPLDLKDSPSIDRLAAALLERFGRLDGLLANAGVLGTIGPLQTLSPSSFEETIAVNLNANWRLIRAVDPLLHASDAGRALFVTSGVAAKPRAFWGAYAASKAGLDAMIACYADENSASKLRINLFNPGPTRTDMRFHAMPGEDPETLPTPEAVAKVLAPYLDADCTAHGERIAYRELTEAAPI